MRYAIIGGGLVGLATALELRRARPDATVQLLEKESQVGRHQSTHNSGVLHSGLYYKPGSLKARMTVGGIRRMIAFCQENGIPHEICGKVVIATDEGEIVRLRDLLARGTQNGLRGLRWLSRGDLREIEPHAGGLAALHVPEEGIVDYGVVCATLARKVAALGVSIVTSARLHRARVDGQAWRLETAAGDFGCDFLINCAGLHSDLVAEAAGAERTIRIVPFRGEYYKLRPSAERLVRNLIYPVPDPVFPFLGVHFTRLIGGGVEAGPNAVLATAREGYRKTDLNLGEFWDAVSFPGLWRFFLRHAAMCRQEVRRSFSKRLFCASLQKLVPEVTAADLTTGGAGVRAQAMTPEGELVQDFAFIEGPNVLHVVNAPSPAATASLAIGEEIVRRVGR